MSVVYCICLVLGIRLLSLHVTTLLLLPPIIIIVLSPLNFRVNVLLCSALRLRHSV